MLKLRSEFTDAGRKKLREIVSCKIPFLVKTQGGIFLAFELLQLTVTMFQFSYK